MVPCGQLIREDNQPLDKTFQYVYNNTTNNVGNVCSVKEYSYTPAGTELSDNPTTTTLYYNDSSNPDRLTKCGYKNITYNSAGFPITCGNKTLAWSLGQLTRYYDDIDENDTSSSESTEFEYNAFGQRIRKEYVYNPGSDYSGDFLIGTTSEYTYDHSGRLIREFTTDYFTESASETRELVFLYDESSMVGFTYSKNGATATSYYYQRNLFGDVVAIYNTSGTKIAGYNYDAWGNHTITASTTTNRIIAKANPIRYRGYYYDEDTKLYYLNARYYSPEWRRFISPDDTSYLDPENVNGLNLYCYCYNDPVNYYDPSGHSAFLIAMSILAVAGLITTGIGVANNNNLMTGIGLTMVAIPSLISGGFAIWGTTGALSTGVGVGTMVAGSFTSVFAGAEYQEAFTGQNFILNTGISEDLYNSLMLTTAGIATLGTIASAVTYSFKIKAITEIGKIKGSDFPGIKFVQTNKGRELYRSLEFHYGHMHKGHKLHWQLNKWSKSGSALKGGTAWWTIWFKRIP